ncbi:trigger factor [Candidatus Saccharibacteria bacterium]|nr:trigger factor [Candidatus Saccharibacteria bacterium]
MKTTVKHLSETKVELTITLGEKELKAAELVALTKLSKDVKVPGFRKGKAPASVVAKNVDPNALGQQTLDDALSKAVAEAFTNEKIQALDRPQVEVKKFVPGMELEFTAETDILPEITIGDYKKLTAKKAKVTVTAKDVTEIIDRMRQGFAEKKSVDRKVKDGDEVVIDFVGKKDGEAFEGGTATDYTLTIGSNQFIPGFEEGLIGHKAGDEFDLDLEFPADYHAKELAGAKVVFSTTLKEVKEIILPELNDELAAKAGPFTSVDELEADIKREITNQKDREALDALKDELIDQLIEVSKVPVPEILVQDQMRSIEQDMTQNLMYQGMNLDMYLESKKLTKEAWQDAEVKPAAEKRVKAGLVLSELSKVEKITATDEELAVKINEYQQQYGDKSGQDFTKPELQRDIANRLLTDKTIDRLVEVNA